VILSGAGSVRGYQVHQVSNRDLPSKNMFVKNPTQPADVISMNGYIIDGRVHAHMMLATPDKAFGGHLEPGTLAFTFVSVTLGIMRDGADFSKIDDKTYGGQPMTDMVWIDEAAEITPEMVESLKTMLPHPFGGAKWIPCPSPKLTIWQRLKKIIDR